MLDLPLQFKILADLPDIFGGECSPAGDSRARRVDPTATQLGQDVLEVREVADDTRRYVVVALLAPVVIFRERVPFHVLSWAVGSSSISCRTYIDPNSSGSCGVWVDCGPSFVLSGQA